MSTSTQTGVFQCTVSAEPNTQTLQLHCTPVYNATGFNPAHAPVQPPAQSQIPMQVQTAGYPGTQSITTLANPQPSGVYREQNAELMAYKAKYGPL
jgi:hypothetical protein